MRHPEIRELDINPLLVDHNGVIALDARIRVADPRAGRRRPLVIRPYPVEWERSLEFAGYWTDPCAARSAERRISL